jgi:CubicO group peptidase (beta-lactamase class C family)
VVVALTYLSKTAADEILIGEDNFGKEPTVKRITLLALSAVLMISATATVAAAFPQDYWPTDGWRTSSPEDQGMISRTLAAGVDYAVSADIDVHSLLVVRNGYLVLDAYFYPFAADTRHDIASVTKTVTSTLIGIAIDKGLVRDVDVPVLDFFEEMDIDNVDERKRSMTIEDLLTMRSGLACYAEPNEPTLFKMISQPDWIQFALDLPMIDEPGTRYEYCSCNSHLLSAIIRKATGSKALEFAEQALFEPLGIADVAWPTDPQGLDNAGWGSLRMTPHDMAKIGFLYLNGGRWDEQQVISSEWIEDAWTKKVSFPDEAGIDGYGRNWWIVSSLGAYGAMGRGGQRIWVAPDMNMVVVLTGASEEDDAELKRQSLLVSYLIGSIESDGAISQDYEGRSLLESKVAAVGSPRPLEGGKQSELPKMAEMVSGKTYILEPNPYGLATFSVVFADEDEALLRVSLVTYDADDNPDLELRVGLDGTCRVSPGRFGLPATMTGYWENDDRLVLEFDEVCNINSWVFRATFTDDMVTIKTESKTGLQSSEFEGRLAR